MHALAGPNPLRQVTRRHAHVLSLIALRALLVDSARISGALAWAKFRYALLPFRRNERMLYAV